MLHEMLVDPTHLLPSTMMVRAYDGFLRQVVGTIKIELFIDPQVFLGTLYVMNIHPSYNMLLGRPWINVLGIVTFSLHQCLKYIVNRMLVIVKDKETLKMV